MSLNKDLTITITNDTEGTTISLKTVSALGNGLISISGDMGVFNLLDIQHALQELGQFNEEKEMTPNELIEGIHL